METVTSTLVVCLYVIVCLSFGLRLTQIIVPRLNFTTPQNWLLVISTSFLLGQGVIAALWQLLGVVGLFKSPVVVVLSLITFGVGVPLLFRGMVSGYAVISQEVKNWWHETALWKIVIFVTLVLLASLALMTYMPPQARGDALAYYMSYPRLIASTGHLSVTPPGYETFAQIGIQGEMHYAYMILFDNTMNPELFTLFTLLAGLGVICCLGNSVGMQYRGKWVLLICALTSSAVTLIVWDGKVDIFGAVMGAAAYVWAFRVHDDEHEEINMPALRLAGIFSGLALIAKISYAVFLPLSIALIIFWRLYLHTKDRHQFRQILGNLIKVGLILAFWAVLPAVPHVIKNTVIFNEPLAPIIAQNNETLVEQSWFTPQTTTKILVTYPISLVFGNFWGQAGQMTPLLLAFLPLIFIFDRRFTPNQQRLLIQICVIAVLGVVLWAFFRASVFAPRYMLTPLILMLIPIALSVEKISLGTTRRGFALLLPIILIFTMSIVLLREEYFLRFSINRFLGRVDECSFEYTNSDGSCRISKIANAEISEDENIIWLSYYSYWLRPNILQCAIIDPTEVPEPYMWESIISYNIKYIFVDTLTHNLAYEYMTNNVPEEITLNPIFNDSTYLGFQVDVDLDRPFEQRQVCENRGSNIWEREVSVTNDEKVPEPPTNLQIIDNHILSWGASARADWYQLRVMPLQSQGTVLYDWFPADALGCEASATCELPLEIASGEYHWYVRAWGPAGLNQGGINGWITAPSFTFERTDTQG